MGKVISKLMMIPACDFCSNYGLSNEIPYYYKIRGLGKFDKRTICQKCLFEKSLNSRQSVPIHSMKKRTCF